MTEECTMKYLKHETTGAVVCVVDATCDNLRTSRALRMVQDVFNERPELKKYTIGVFAKADKAYDRDWEDEGRDNAFWKLSDRLLGKSDDFVPLDCGYYAVKNR